MINKKQIKKKYNFNQIFKFIMMILVFILWIYNIFYNTFVERNKIYMIGGILILIGILSNLFALSFNNLRMPVKLKDNKYNIEDKIHKIIKPNEKVKFYYLTDIIRIKHFIFSIGDILIWLGAIIVIIGIIIIL